MPNLACSLTASSPQSKYARSFFSWSTTSPYLFVVIQEYGVFVTFFNGVTGLVGRDQLSNSFIARPEEVYSVGQVVKCRVLTCDAVQKRISLSFLVLDGPRFFPCTLSATKLNPPPDRKKLMRKRRSGKLIYGKKSSLEVYLLQRYLSVRKNLTSWFW